MALQRLCLWLNSRRGRCFERLQLSALEGFERLRCHYGALLRGLSLFPPRESSPFE